MRSNTQLNENISEILNHDILTPILETIIEKCNSRELTLKLIEEAKGGQLGKKRLEEVSGKYDSELLEALNHISRLYENPVWTVRAVFGENTPDAQAIKALADEIINSSIRLYFPVIREQEEFDAERRNTMHMIRQKLLESILAKDKRVADAEIMRLKQHAGIINTGIVGGHGGDLNLSNLDLSGLDLRGRCFKQVAFDNSNLSNTKFRHIPRCKFNNCNLEGADFTDADLQGEDVSFTNANVRHAKFINTKLEKKASWTFCKSPIELKDELIARGARHANQSFFTKTEYRLYKEEKKANPGENRTSPRNMP